MGGNKNSCPPAIRNSGRPVRRLVGIIVYVKGYTFQLIMSLIWFLALNCCDSDIYIYIYITV